MLTSFAVTQNAADLSFVSTGFASVPFTSGMTMAQSAISNNPNFPPGIGIVSSTPGQAGFWFTPKQTGGTNDLGMGYYPPGPLVQSDYLITDRSGNFFGINPINGDAAIWIWDGAYASSWVLPANSGSVQTVNPSLGTYTIIDGAQ